MPTWRPVCLGEMDHIAEREQGRLTYSLPSWKPREAQGQHHPPFKILFSVQPQVPLRIVTEGQWSPKRSLFTALYHFRLTKLLSLLKSLWHISSVTDVTQRNTSGGRSLRETVNTFTSSKKQDKDSMSEDPNMHVCGFCFSLCGPNVMSRSICMQPKTLLPCGFIK